MSGVSESERVWTSIDRLTKAVGRLCERATAIETKQKTSQDYLECHNKHAYKTNIIIIGIIGAVLTGINVFVNFV